LKFAHFLRTFKAMSFLVGPSIESSSSHRFSALDLRREWNANQADGLLYNLILADSFDYSLSCCTSSLICKKTILTLMTGIK
jgi:hypothetical protein